MPLNLKTSKYLGGQKQIAKCSGCISERTTGNEGRVDTNTHTIFQLGRENEQKRYKIGERN